MTKSKSEHILFKKEQELVHLKHLCKELKAENSKLHKNLAKLEARNLTLTNTLNEFKKVKPKKQPEEKPLTDREKARRIAFAAHKEGITPLEFIEKYAKP